MFCRLCQLADTAPPRYACDVTGMAIHPLGLCPCLQGAPCPDAESHVLYHEALRCMDTHMAITTLHRQRRSLLAPICTCHNGQLCCQVKGIIAAYGMPWTAMDRRLHMGRHQPSLYTSNVVASCNQHQPVARCCFRACLGTNDLGAYASACICVNPS